jgi:hypothetical protein
MQLLGFNAVRLPFSFKDFNLKGRTDYIWCREASASEIRRTVSPPGFVPWSKPLPPPRAPLLVGGGRCNIGMPNNVFDRFLWVINYFAKAGFKVGSSRSGLRRPRWRTGWRCIAPQRGHGRCN